MQGGRIDRSVASVLLPLEVRRVIRREAVSWGLMRREACGALVGWRRCVGGGPCYLIVARTLIGPRTRHGATSCYTDASYVEEYLGSDGSVEYLGEWHSHYFQSHPRPSPGDIDSIVEMNVFDDGAFQPSVSMIAGIGDGVLRLRAYSYWGGRVHRVPIQYIGRGYGFDELDLDVYNRISRVHDLNRLSRRTVAIVGLGSGGSNIALLLAKAGVGRLLLVDDDVYVPSNVIRSAPTMAEVGYSKVEAVRRLIRRYGLKTIIRGYEYNVGEAEWSTLRGTLGKADVIIDATGNVKAHFTLNDLGLALGKPVVMSWASEKAARNIIFLMLAGLKGYRGYACYECLHKHGVFEGLPYDGGGLEERLHRYGYDMDDVAELAAAQGLQVDLTPVIGYTARLALNILNGGLWSYTPNLYIIDQEEISVEKLLIPSHPQCSHTHPRVEGATSNLVEEG
ncbi:MAG: ThiF family adenylyltransferase [Desulfurococcales archaeon]|nr:ThiF family adenylyltransferase [Desulfurococcales archaeon]